jgi:adenylate cyclase
MAVESSSTQAFLFADLAGFTALTEAHGDEEATELAENFAERVRALLPEYGGELVKTIGDEVMVRVATADRAVELGLRIVDELARPGLPPVRVGIHCGRAVSRHGDWFGSTINLASRVNGAARTGEVLLTESTRQRLTANGVTIEPRGERYFRHVVDPVPVYRAVSPEGDAGHHLEIDPVCRMAVDPAAPAGTRHRRGERYYFCSGDCLQAFDANPRRYVASSPAARVARRGFLINLGAFLGVGAFHAIGWITASGHEPGAFPTFVIVAVVWALLLAFHYRAVRRVL